MRHGDALRYPNEPVYRHSLAEETDAFGQLLAFADEQDRKGQPIADPHISTIRGRRERGMLQAYVESMIIAPQR